MERENLFKYAGFVALFLLVVGALDALDYKDFSYGLGLSISCNMGVVAFLAAIFGAVWLVDPHKERIPKNVPTWARWAIGLAIVTAVVVVIPRPRSCPSHYSAEY